MKETILLFITILNFILVLYIGNQKNNPNTSWAYLLYMLSSCLCLFIFGLEAEGLIALLMGLIGFFVISTFGKMMISAAQFTKVKNTEKMLTGMIGLSVSSGLYIFWYLIKNNNNQNATINVQSSINEIGTLLTQKHEILFVSFGILILVASIGSLSMIRGKHGS